MRHDGLTWLTVTGMATDPVTGGYWILTSNGGVHNYGAPFYGSARGTLPAAVTAVGLAANPATGGYWILRIRWRGGPVPRPLVRVSETRWPDLADGDGDHRPVGTACAAPATREPAASQRQALDPGRCGGLALSSLHRDSFIG